MTRVLVVDNDALVRSGLSLILGAADDMEVTTSTGAEAVETVIRQPPHVVLLDVRMPDVDGLTVLRHILALPSPPRVAMLTTFDMDDYVLAALRSGAAGFLLKDTEPAELVAAIQVLARGGTVLSPKVAPLVVNGFLQASGSPDAQAAVAELSGREREVLTLVAAGLSNLEIAAQLYLSAGTIKDHVSAILVKLGAVNRLQAAMIAHRARRIDS